ncbi:SDR family NAD(P)-dependent oxidoreductase [Candidatus Poriferisodalis sp.]|uniref:SDR family NAD(P)-dependent oxidoreductase n=1 Tax=Candidatus Poriferisodalis sp. TaxID=3101277 RepID=UPI003B01CE52
MRDITGCVAMISGANRGIGESIAAALHADGWALSLGARDMAALEASAAVYRTDVSGDADDAARRSDGSRRHDGGPAVTLHRYDATDLDAAERWTAETIAAHGRIDCLVNNAGVAHTDVFEELTEDMLDEMWEVNAKGPFRMLRATLDHLRRSGEGRIVNVISMSGKRVRGTFAPGYAMSKHAAMALHHSVRHLTFPDGIRCTAVCPGYVQTDMTSGFGVDPSIMIQADDLAQALATILRLPNTASVAELLVTTEPETIA